MFEGVTFESVYPLFEVLVTFFFPVITLVAAVGLVGMMMDMIKGFLPKKDTKDDE